MSRHRAHQYLNTGAIGLVLAVVGSNVAIEASGLALGLLGVYGAVDQIRGEDDHEGDHVVATDGGESL